MSKVHLNLSFLGRKRGMTLVEVVIAIVLAGFVSLGLYGSAIYTARQAHANRQHQYALMVIQGAASKVRAARFEELASTTTLSVFEQGLRGTQVEYGDPKEAQPTQYTVTYQYKGFGRVASASGSSLVAQVGGTSGVEPFVPNEWVGHKVMITGGQGTGQVMHITANTVDTLTVTNDLTGASNGSWPGTVPNNSSYYFIDHGKHCDITVSWGDEDHESITRRVFVPRPPS